MLIFNEHSTPVIIHSIQSPNIPEYMWVFDMAERDFMLSPIQMVEESFSPSMQVSVRGFDFVVPASWNILVYDRDTAQVDVIEIAEAAGREFTAMIYGPNKSQPSPGVISITNYFIDRKNVNPSLNKHQMLCHPISTTEWVVVGPSDGFNKYLKDLSVGDLIG